MAVRGSINDSILYVLRTGCQWNAAPREFGSSSTLHRYFQEWTERGVFFRLFEDQDCAPIRLECGIGVSLRPQEQALLPVPVVERLGHVGPGPMPRQSARIVHPDFIRMKMSP